MMQCDFQAMPLAVKVARDWARLFSLSEVSDLTAFRAVQFMFEKDVIPGNDVLILIVFAQAVAGS